MDLRERLADATSELRGHVLGILVWGSALDEGELTNRSDLDVCVVAGPDPPREDPVELERWLWRRTPAEVDDRDLDLKVFEAMPRWLQGAVLEDHEVLWSDDEPALYEHLYPYRRLWEHQRHRHQLTRDEARDLVRGEG